MSDAYAAAGVDIGQSDAAVAAIVGALGRIELGRPSRSVLRGGHYASVLRVTDELGIAFTTDGVGSKLVVAEQTDRLETVGIDCVAMNVNDLICVGAEPIALVDYLAVEEPDPERLGRIAEGLRVGAQAAGVEIPGGELAVLPELIRGHPSPHGFDLCAPRIGTVALDAIVTGEAIAAGDALVGVPSTGLHSNGYTLARRALLSDGGLGLRRPAARAGRRDRRRRAARADGHLRARGARAAALRRAGPRPRAHHRRRARQPQAPARRRRLPAGGPAARSRRSSGSCSGSATCPTRRCGASSTWAAASSPSCPSGAADEAAARCWPRTIPGARRIGSVVAAEPSPSRHVAASRHRRRRRRYAAGDLFEELPSMVWMRPSGRTDSTMPMWRPSQTMRSPGCGCWPAGTARPVRCAQSQVAATRAEALALLAERRAGLLGGPGDEVVAPRADAAARRWPCGTRRCAGSRWSPAAARPAPISACASATICAPAPVPAPRPARRRSWRPRRSPDRARRRSWRRTPSARWPSPRRRWRSRRRRRPGLRASRWISAMRAMATSTLIVPCGRTARRPGSLKRQKGGPEGPPRSLLMLRRAC